MQRELDRCRTIYNCERPREAIGMDTPVGRYRPSPRTYPSFLQERSTVPTRWCCGSRQIGQLRFEGRHLKVSNALYGLPVAARAKLDEDGVFEFWFAHHRIMTLDLKSETQSP